MAFIFPMGSYKMVKKKSESCQGAIHGRDEKVLKISRKETCEKRETPLTNRTYTES